ncbi:Gata transcription factor [Lasiodiplodia theobromae]|uniref:Gata transcription factor n=1 Tax=Lasiodiplodia theobromae TaxID=45133 RepID=UPI0015C3C27A|nr:Gata transcription factor [Lasiodiplodia theobromae]KAF4538725.1 Gata transcription factor [Lasiodiplodia theobromae]
MSSPFTYGEPSPLTMPVVAGDDDDDPTSDIPRRLMRVKVLYTFDDSHKTCCLARLPNALNIPTVPIDEENQVGVIELRTCIEAIVAASPELVAKLGHDYTVYAYDYSEYETPLVGQGMLSWILATSSPTPNAPASSSKTMVTGKVRENILGLFSGGIKETLEVKLKLVPVPTFLQSEYLETMERYRNISRALPEGFDHSQWAALKSNPEFNAFAAQTAVGSSQSSMAMQRVNSGGVETLHQLLTQKPVEERRGSQGHAQTLSHSRQGSRAASTAASVRVHKPTPINPAAGGSANSLEPPPRAPTPIPHELPQSRNRPSVGGASSLRRESSSQSMRRYTSPYAPRGPYSECAIASEDEQMADAEDSPADFPSSPPVFGVNNDSPAASSPGLPTLPYPDDSGFMSVHQTTEPHTEPPSAVICSDQWQFETPGPPELLPTNVGRRQPDYRSQRAAASAKRMTPGPGPKPETRGRKRNDSKPPPPPPPPPRNLAPAPPAQTRPAFMPQHQSPVASCPPVPHPPQSQPHHQPQPSVQQKPDSLPQPVTQHQPTHPPQPPTQPSAQSQHPPQVQTRPESDTQSQESSNQPQSSLPQQQPQQVPHQSQPQAPQAASQPPVASAISPPATVTSASPEAPMSATQRSSKPAKKSSAAPKAKKTLPRSNTWSAGTPKESQADEPVVTYTESRAASPVPRSGSGAKRKKAIEDRLMQSLAEGTMPDFCECCGAIQTPTWRKAFYKEIEGRPAGIVTSLDEPGAIVGFEVIQPHPDEENPVEKYKVYKKSLTNLDKNNGDFTKMQLCNPCGLHFFKYGNMRPADRWEVKPRAAGVKKRSGGKPAKKKKGDEKQTMQTSDAIQDLPSQMMSDYPDYVMEYMDHEQGPEQEPKQAEQQQQDQPEQNVLQPSVSESVDTRPVEAQSSHDRAEDALRDQRRKAESRQEEQSAKRQRVENAQERRAVSLEPHREDSNSSQESVSAAADVDRAALARAIQSSPPRLTGFQEGEIELEDDFSPSKPTRRILFPSPRRSGQFKSLEDGQREKGISQPVFGQIPRPPRSEPATDAQDKENVPPAEMDDGFAHLFEDPDGNQLQNCFKSPTPRSAKSIRTLPDFLKTPSSRSKRAALGTRDDLLSPASAAVNAVVDDLLLHSTPSKASRTPKAVMSPFSQAFLNDIFNTTKTPRSAARNGAGWGLSSPDNTGLMDFTNFDFGMAPSTDIPFPSSPPNFGASFNFSLYEDPLTSTANFWGGTSVFNGSSDPVQAAQAEGEQTKENGALENREIEFERIIDEVTSNANKSGEKESAKSADTTVTTTENDSENTAAATPAGSEAAVDLIPVGP